jgi:hypothetical protein
MEIKKIIMTDGNEYLVFGYELALMRANGFQNEIQTFNEDIDSNGFLNIIDINLGWVSLQTKYISEIIPSWNKSNPHLLINPKARKEIIEQYGEEEIRQLKLN